MVCDRANMVCDRNDACRDWVGKRFPHLALGDVEGRLQVLRSCIAELPLWKCLAEETAGLYIRAENRQDLVKAFEKTLGCP